MITRRTEDLTAADRGYYVTASQATTAWPYVETITLAGPFPAEPFGPLPVSRFTGLPVERVRFWNGAVWQAVT